MPAWLTDLVILAPWLAALGLAVWVVWKVYPTVRKLGHFVDDVAGEPARAGQPARPGLMERIATVEGQNAEFAAGTAAHREHLSERLDRMQAGIDTVTHELFPNGGDSVRDQIDETRRQGARTEKKVDQAIAWQKKHEKKSDAIVDRVKDLEEKGHTP